MSTRLLRGAALVAAFVPLALAMVPAPALGQGWKPSVTWSSYLGGDQVDELRDAVATADDGVIVVGQTGSTIGFPADAGLPMSGTGRDAFVARFNPDGSLAWTRVFGGNGDDLARRVQLVPNGSGDVFVVGTLTQVSGQIHTSSTTTRDPAGGHSYKGGDSDAFLARVRADGELLWFIFVGGSAADDGVSLAVSETTVYVGGRSRSSSTSFSGATKVGTRGDTTDAFVSQVDLTDEGSPKVVWTRFIGTEDALFGAEDTAYALLVKGTNVYVAGTVSSVFSESGVTPIERFHEGAEDGFVAKLKPTTGDIEWFTNVGSEGTDDVRDLLAVPGEAGLIVVGRTNSPNFPRSGTGAGGGDTYVLRLGENGVRVPGGVRVGKGGNEEVAQAAVDALGNVFVGGRTTSSDLAQNAFDTTYNGSQEGFVAMVDAALTQPIWVSYVGGNNSSAEEWVRAMVAGPQGRLTLVGSSDATDVLQAPVRHDAVHNGRLDGILFRLEVDPSAPSTGQLVASISETGILATWGGFPEPSMNFTDPETGISRYEWAIGHSGQRDNVKPFTSVKTTADSSRFQPQAGLTYSVTVRAFNGVGRPSNEVRSTDLPWLLADGGTGNVDAGTGNVDAGTPDDVNPQSPLGWGCGSTGGGGLAGALGLVALASLMARRARRAPGSER